MNKLQTKVHNVLTALAGKMADGEPRGWPPECLGFAYQPMRPNTPAVTDDTNWSTTEEKR